MTQILPVYVCLWCNPSRSGSQFACSTVLQALQGVHATTSYMSLGLVESPPRLLPRLWYFSAWNFKTRYTKLDCLLGKNLWNIYYFFQYYVIEESRASEVVKYRSL